MWKAAGWEQPALPNSSNVTLQGGMENSFQSRRGGGGNGGAGIVGV